MSEMNKIVIADELTRVKWQMGQTLLPAHMIAQEESMLSHIRHYLRLIGVPFYGIGKLELHDSLLAEGIFSVVNLALVFPSGHLIDIPGNTEAHPFNMNVTGHSEVSIYAHLLNTGVEEQADDKDKSIVEKIVYQIQFSSQQSNAQAIQSIKLAELKKDAEGVWSFSEDYIPPLLQVGTSPFLMNTIDYLAQLLEVFHFKIEREIASSYLSGESLLSAKQCLQGVYKIQSFITNLKTQVHCHPYHLYEALKAFYIDVCLFQNFTPENINVPYLHDQLAKSLKQIYEPLMKQMQLLRGKAPYMPFEKKEGMFVISQLPEEAKSGHEIYFLLQKPHISDHLPIDNLKLASLARVSAVHQLSLRGVPLKKIDRPPFQHSFGAEVDFYRVEEGEEWDHVLSEGALAFYDRPALANAKAYLYWRVI